MKKTLLSLVLLSSLSLLSRAAVPMPAGAIYDLGVPLSVAGYAGSTPLANFPVLVRLAENSPAGFHYAALHSATNGADVCFVDALGVGLPFEIDTWNTNGDSFVWVRLPSMSQGTTFYMCWGSDTSGKGVCSANPWSDYAGVWHMNETNDAAATIYDATDNHLDATATSVSFAQPSGKFGGARTPTKNGDGKNANCIKVGLGASNSTERAVVDGINTDDNGHSFTVSMWVKPEKYNGAGTPQSQYLVSRKFKDETGAWGVQYHYSNNSSTDYGRIRTWGRETAKGDNDMLSFDFDNSVIPSKASDCLGKWYKYDVVYSGSDVTFYVNGGTNALAVLTGTLKIGPAGNDSGDLYLAGTADSGTREFCGDMDEVRLRGGAMSAVWVAADWATQTDPAFLSAGQVEAPQELTDPAASLATASIAYTNATIAVTVAALGGTGSMDVDVEISATDDFATILQTESTTATGTGGYDVSFVGLSFGTTYYARAVLDNHDHAPVTTDSISFTTLSPGAPEGTAAFFSRGFTTLTATASASDIGTGAQSATIRLEASTDGFTNVVASTEVSAVPGQTETLVAENLTPGATYRLRVRIVNDWGLATYLDLPDATTYAVPFAVTGIGWTFSPDGSTVDFTFGVSDVFDGATGTATLEYAGRPVPSQTFSSAGTLVWTNVTAAAGTATATVTVSANVGGTTYTHAWTAIVTPGSSAYAASSLSDLSGMFFRVGDSATLPELAGADYYVVMDIRSFSLGEDGVTLTALEPGFSTVVSLAWDGATSAYAVADHALAVCIPEVAGSGRVFFAKPGAKMNWEDSSKWTNVTDPSAAADYPHLAGDVAMAALPDNQLILNADATIAELYLGPDENHMHTGTQRLTGKNAATLTFARPSGKPGLLRFTGMFRTDTPALSSSWNKFAIGGGDGNSTSTGLGIEMPGGLEFDCGTWPDYTDTAVRNTFGRARYWISDKMRHWNIPEGKTLRISNTSGRKQEGDSQDPTANFRWESGSQVTGRGTFFYDAAASLLSKGMFRTFEGVVKVANKQAYDTFAPGDRGGGFKFRPELYSSFTNSTASVAENATLLLEGDANGSDVKTSFGVVNAGHSHGHDSWGRAINAYPAKKWILDGGYVYQTCLGSTDVNWREDGTTATQPVCTPNGAATLCVSNGFNYVKLSQNSNVASPTNSLSFAALEHAGDGVLLVRSDRIFNSYDKNGAGSGWRDRTVLGGFHDLAVGGTGRAVIRHGDETVRTNYLEATAPIVPWIVAPVKADSSLYFPGADDDTDELVMAGVPKATVLDTATDPMANVYVDGTTIALAADRTVNSLVLVNNRTAGKNLGAGRTLTIASGGLIMGNGNFNNTAYLGDESGFNAGTAGTVVFPNKAFIFVPVIKDDKNYHPEIWAQIVSPQGAVFSYPGDLHLGGDQTGIDDHIAVNGTDLRLGTETTGCQIDVPVHIHGAFARLRIGKPGSFCRQDLYFWDHLTTGSKFEAAAGTEEVVHKLFVDGVSMPRGYYGSSDAAASIADLATRQRPAFVDDAHFAGTGWIKVLTDECLQPTIMILR
ncbi:MAG: hypothetical protein IJL06_04260 [Kiritimatiellae bacterium]|nr:hypothetical protein [Kiritimatiellia bacterium]